MLDCRTGRPLMTQLHEKALTHLRQLEAESIHIIREAAERSGIQIVAATGFYWTKVWVTDPDGNRWEVFVVLEDAGARCEPDAACCETAAAEAGASSGECCPA